MTAAAELRAQIGRIDEQLASLKSQLTSLRTAKKQLLQDLDRLVYPVLTLPPEISSEIFRHVAPKFAPNIPNIGACSFQKYYWPLQLASVCRAWRAIALSTPALWSVIAIFGDSTRDFEQLLRLWLARARSLPLDLYISLTLDPVSHTILSILAPYASQWRHVSLESFSPFTLPVHLFPGPLRLLESLKVIVLQPHDATLAPSSLDAPRLRELFITFPFTVFRTGLPLTQLTTFRVVGSLSPVFEVLALAPNLESLCLTILSQGATPPSPLTLPHLCTLEFLDNPSMVAALDFLILPALENLKVSGLRNGGLKTLRSCVSRSCCTVRTLDLRYTDYSPAYRCFESLRSIQTLCLRDSTWTDDEMNTFCCEMRLDLCLPALESLTVDGAGPKDVVHLAAMVAERWSGVAGTAKMRTFSLSYNDADTGRLDRALDALDDLERDGLKLDLTEVLGSRKKAHWCVSRRTAATPLQAPTKIFRPSTPIFRDIVANDDEPGTFGIAWPSPPSRRHRHHIRGTGPFAGKPVLCQTLINVSEGFNLIGLSLLKDYYSAWDMDMDVPQIGFVPNGF
ncbi:hypothetical protein GGX14DRAFT_579537 [Mycena pura]|uniref:F-box domain-containing protein n=1 Tax=Mycena pura TaxID=153505 RepID=A0AAD6URW7_9AGAR|nr:hypothetical protein GGX14DRAFT_579537 [Mycena pura]